VLRVKLVFEGQYSQRFLKTCERPNDSKLSQITPQNVGTYKFNLGDDIKLRDTIGMEENLNITQQKCCIDPEDWANRNS